MPGSDSQIKLSRLSGAENTFLATYATADAVARMARPSFVKKACDDFNGKQTDGLFFIEILDDTKPEMKWDFYNSDGSEAEMCGNAARCAALFFFRDHSDKKSVQLKTESGTVTCRRLQGSLESMEIEVEMPKANLVNASMQIRQEGRLYTGFLINTGVPHFVMDISVVKKHFPHLGTLADLTDAKVILKSFNEEAMKLRRHSDFGAPGANITLVSGLQKTSQAVTFERGVHDWTQACGTGAVAAAFYLRANQHQYYKNNNFSEENILVQMPGGLLSINLKNEKPLLLGPTQFEFTMTLTDQTGNI